MPWSFTGHRASNEEFATIMVGIQGDGDWCVREALIDTGASHTCISRKFAIELGLDLTGRDFVVAEASREVAGKICDALLRFISGTPEQLSYYDVENLVVAIDNMSRDIIIGMSTLSIFEIAFGSDKSFTISRSD